MAPLGSALCEFLRQPVSQWPAKVGSSNSDGWGGGDMVPFVDLKSQYAGMKKEIDSAISEVLESSQFVLGKEVSSFENDFAFYCGAKHAVGLNSGTSALHLALLA